MVGPPSGEDIFPELGGSPFLAQRSELFEARTTQQTWGSNTNSPMGPWVWIFVFESVWLVFPKIGVPPNGWFTMQNPIKMDDLGGFPPIFGNTHVMLRAPLPETNSKSIPLKIGRKPKRKRERIPSINFQVFLCWFQGG